MSDQIEETTTEEREHLGTATYSPEDNKLRFYPFHRLSAVDYATIKAAGFKWAPKQELFVAPRWTTAAEDLLLEWCEEIGDEDYSPEERAADRADRFSGYRDKRRSEAGGFADRFDSGPSAFGHQSAARAERQARRHDRLRGKACSQWSKAEYWQRRTAGVISNALHKSDPSTRRGRILRLEAEQRKHNATIDQAKKRWNAWTKIAAMGADQATHVARQYAGTDTGWIDFKHPRNDREASLYSLLTDNEDPITGHEAAALYLSTGEPNQEGSGCWRWQQHYILRLTYENAMLENEGGKAAEVEMEVGGWIGRHQIQKINRSVATGRVVSVMVWGKDPYDRSENPKRVLCKVNIERAGSDIYRSPTNEEREAFKVSTAQRKAEEKATTPKLPSLINPTLEDAQRLQDIWNKRSKEVYDKHNPHTSHDYSPSVVIEMTQEQYSRISKGSYARGETITVCVDGHEPTVNYWQQIHEPHRPPACKVRKTYGKTLGGGNRSWSAQANSVIVITDKPQKPLPLDWDGIAAGRVGVPETVTA